ncbi:DUF1003 domain-containing protein [Patescibacteria group bacterium]|nr:DUF1003 domain-containing protein [Patescibacteria group bacterium]
METSSHRSSRERTTTPIRNVNIEHKENLTRLERVALWITERVGTMGFTAIVVGWTIGWLLWNTFAPHGMRFDPYPGFVLWLFISNVIQLFLTPMIMIGQNLQSRHSEARAEADFEVNVHSEEQIEMILQHLEDQTDLILQIVKKLEERK